MSETEEKPNEEKPIKPKKRLAEGAKTNLKVIGIVVVIVSGLYIGTTSFFGRDQKRIESAFQPVETVRVTGQASGVSDKYKEIADKSNELGASTAAQQGKSFVPNLGATDVLPTGGDRGGDAAPPVNLAPPPPPPRDYRQYETTERTNRRREAISHLIDKEWGPAPAQEVILVKAEKDQASERAEGSGSSSAAPAAGVVIGKGQVCYAELISPINTDIKDVTIIAELLHCPAVGGNMAGALLFGKPVRQDEFIVTNFFLMNHQKRGYEISAVALDEATSSSVLSGEVDRHLFARYWLPMLTEFVSGYGKAASRQNTTVHISTAGISETAGELKDRDKLLAAAGEAAKVGQQIVQESIKGREITVKRPGQTTVGIVFLTDVH